MRLPDGARGAGEHGGIGGEFVERDGLVGDAVDERGVGAVLQQAAHEIGEQGLVAADGGVDAARAVELVLADDLLVERLAHAVQALELVLAAIEVRPGEHHHRGERLGVVGRELRIDGVGRGEQLAGAGEIGDVGVDLAREDGEVGQAVRLARA